MDYFRRDPETSLHSCLLIKHQRKDYFENLMHLVNLPTRLSMTPNIVPAREIGQNSDSNPEPSPLPPQQTNFFWGGGGWGLVNSLCQLPIMSPVTSTANKINIQQWPWSSNISKKSTFRPKITDTRSHSDKCQLPACQQSVLHSERVVSTGDTD